MSSRGPTLEAKGSAQWIPISESCFELASLSIRAAQRDTHLPNVQIAKVSLDYFSYAGWVASRFWHLKAWSLPKRRSIEVRRGTQVIAAPWTSAHDQATPCPQTSVLSLHPQLPDSSHAFQPILLGPQCHWNQLSDHTVLPSILRVPKCTLNRVNSSMLRRQSCFPHPLSLIFPRL